MKIYENLRSHGRRKGGRSENLRCLLLRVVISVPDYGPLAQFWKISPVKGPFCIILEELVADELGGWPYGERVYIWY